MQFNTVSAGHEGGGILDIFLQQQQLTAHYLIPAVQNTRTQVREAIANVLGAIVAGARRLPLREGETNPLSDFKVRRLCRRRLTLRHLRALFHITMV